MNDDTSTAPTMHSIRVNDCKSHFPPVFNGVISTIRTRECEQLSVERDGVWHRLLYPLREGYMGVKHPCVSLEEALCNRKFDTWYVSVVFLT